MAVVGMPVAVAEKLAFAATPTPSTFHLCDAPRARFACPTGVIRDGVSMNVPWSEDLTDAVWHPIFILNIRKFLMNRSIKRDGQMSQVNFDLASLRSFVTGMDMGSFAKAADKVGRSTSAISAQIKKLEEQAGKPLFRKAGRGLALTDAGQMMLRYARRLIELNDEAAAAVRGTDLEGWVRLGLQEDFGETLLPEVLGSFARAHPKVRIEARVARNADLVTRL